MSSAEALFAELLADLRSRGVRLELEPIRRLLDALGRPQDRFPCIAVAGTNGKGSTAAFLASMLEAAGKRVGLFTSPELEEPEDQIRLDGRRIDRALFVDLLREIEATGLKPTLFEATTAAALLAFARHDIEIAVLEAGLGGRRDGVNAVDPILAVLTSVDLDHAEQLGGTLGAIAEDKAGILRPGRPAVVGWLASEARQVVRAEAERLGAVPRFADTEILALSTHNQGWAGQQVELTTTRRSYALEIALPGLHQAHNLALAVLAAECLVDDLRLDAEAIRHGVAACRWPGRLELVHRPRRLLLDAAHNPAGAEALAVFLESLDEPYDLLFGAFLDKDALPMMRRLGAAARRIHLTAPDHPRAAEPGRLESMLRAAEPDWTIDLDPPTLDDPAAPLLVVTGSLRLVGEVRSGRWSDRQRATLDASRTDGLRWKTERSFR